MSQWLRLMAAIRQSAEMDDTLFSRLEVLNTVIELGLIPVFSARANFRWPGVQP